ncbi:MAG: hypothetical protein ACRDDY_13785 [Clostridium sp.]|uniref:hypothetical protein n=1 Tax=Clostridium sp. TaxID=1506 RepID=UPI003EE7F523
MIGRREAKVVKQGDTIVSVNTGERKNLEGTTEFKPTVVLRPERTAVVDSTYLDHSRLAPHLSGAPMKAVYYSSVVGKDDTLRPLDLKANPVNQQYHCYRDMILRVTSPLNPSSQDTDSKEFNLVGSADMYYVMPPNKYDMFVADAGGASTGIFTITDVEKLSHLKFSAYRVDYKLVGIDNMEMLQNLEAKSIRTMYYDESLFDYFNTPFLDEDTKKKYETLGEILDDLHRDYLDTFWDQARFSFRMPTADGSTVFDPLISDYIRYIGLEDVQRPATTWGVGALDLTRCKTLWWLLKQEGYESLRYVTRDVRPYPVKQFNVHARMRNITYSPYAVVMYPIVKGPYENTDTNRLYPTTVDYGSQEESEDFPVIGRSTYVLSEAFYSGDVEKMCTIERLLASMLKSDPVNVNKLIDLAKAIPTMEYIRRFYLTPILITIISSTRRKPIWL